jgi:hypothetical protein
MRQKISVGVNISTDSVLAGRVVTVDHADSETPLLQAKSLTWTQEVSEGWITTC